MKIFKSNLSNQTYFVPTMYGIFFVLILLLETISYAQDDTVGTLVPPTLVPMVASADTDVLPSTSTVARIQQNGIVRVGILYNEPPYGEYNIRGEVSGYDADVARAIAETWGVEIEFLQESLRDAAFR
jgi:ABC-type amino acid transport substrate-binding protein